jgi:hypothetical protein
MPTVTPRSAAAGPLFCGEHQAVAATHVIASGGTVLALCGACVTELAELLPAVRLSFVPTARNNWRPPVAGPAR